jgi:predicted TIM-barrel fold metal-dependent hydrolase
VTYDIHQHLWPDTLLAVLRGREAPPFVRGSELVTIEGSFPVDLASHDPERRIAALDRDGIDVAVLSLQPTLGAEALSPAEREEIELTWAEGAAELARESDGRFRAFAPWRVLDGFAGTSVGATALTEPGAHTSLLAQADAAGGVLFVHPEAERAPPPGLPDWWCWAAGYTTQMQRAYLSWLAVVRDRYPRLRVVFAILAGGAPFQLERLSRRGVEIRSSLDPNAFLDTASYGRRAIELCIETFGVTQLVYGSDTPVVDPAETLRAVRGFGESVAHVLQTETPKGLLS